MDTGLALTIAACLGAAYVSLLAALVLVRPRGDVLVGALRLLPDLLRLVRRLAADREVPRGPRLALWLLLGYLALPFDVVPDLVPVVGLADDVILAGLVLRWAMASSGAETVRRHWPGSADGLRVLAALTRLPLEGAGDESPADAARDGGPQRLPGVR